MVSNGGSDPRLWCRSEILGQFWVNCLGNIPGETLSEILAQKAWRPELLTQDLRTYSSSCSSAPLGQSFTTLKEMAGTPSLERSCSVLTIFRRYGSADICVALHAYEWLRFNLASCKRM